MKQLFITIAFLALASTSIAQRDSTFHNGKKWTVGAILMNETNSYLDKQFEPRFLNGIVAKRHFKHFSIRGGMEYYNKYEKTDDNACCDQIYSEGKRRGTTIRVGIERGNAINKFLRPYYALDVVAVQVHYDKVQSGGIASIYQRVVANSLAFGLAPTIGLDVKIIRNFSATIETRVLFVAGSRTKEITDLGKTGFSRIIKETGEERAVNRLGVLSLNYNF